MKVNIFSSAALAFSISTVHATSLDLGNALARNTLLAANESTITRDHRNFVARANIDKSCNEKDKEIVKKGLENCVMVANLAAKAVDLPHPDNMLEAFFKSTSKETADTVRTVFQRAAKECKATWLSHSTIWCVDNDWPDCPDALAWYYEKNEATKMKSDVIVLCPRFFEKLSDLNKDCQQQDRATVLLHEMTHIMAVKGTSDYVEESQGGYGYFAIQQLSGEQNLNHANTYEMYAHYMYTLVPDTDEPGADTKAKQCIIV